MTAPLQSDAKAFIRSLGGARDAEFVPPPIVFGDETYWEVTSRFCSFGAISRTNCETFLLENIGVPRGQVTVDAGFSFDVSVTNITTANPAVVTTATDHGLTNSMKAIVFGQTGMPELPATPQKVSVLSTTTYAMVDIDSSAFTPYVSGGTSRVAPVEFFGNVRIVGQTSSEEFTYYLNCFTSNHVGRIYDEAGVPVPFRSFVEQQGANHLLHFPDNTTGVCPETPAFVAGERLLVSLITTAPVFLQLPDRNWNDHTVTYNEQVSLTFGNGPGDADKYDVLEPAGATINASLNVSYNFSAGDVGNTITFTVYAENVVGNDTMSWDVTVLA